MMHFGINSIDAGQYTGRKGYTVFKNLITRQFIVVASQVDSFYEVMGERWGRNQDDPIWSNYVKVG
ncbi:MAG: hypothetical protein COY38_04380 [Candidatus Aenigmarchaeota archaeon CG_4_10_14_0_8_um_filter_37_24]|nr:hypothetical protein [Candidatus Aenigmarchaeota archaeon]OIN85337.1 MAG: hypothetical protein AUJ50_05175 [Candidatus Aenigmarchaeota archaeon CG1_02_38_14]PIV69161.1 MAG: hypothetical protein COS07_01680 [Candidatus Aenigmarchaeota archaeon CG01_land_8_20_14_3_00_37_9]PIW40883.1 MAG: hypothetical protein COW21_04775 [Candidatus Aenigmarchaeota archaeon CG15_BIG_FIL_POST_REV_8_21_14_020_37_27]PIX51156.1 MAG: hypothetical protein COZ52_00255 [Candidatus Aenigmarchaeota archaeon CG_4_8_14_3_u